MPSLSWWYVMLFEAADQEPKRCSTCRGVLYTRYIVDSEGRTIEKVCVNCGRGPILYFKEHGKTRSVEKHDSEDQLTNLTRSLDGSSYRETIKGLDK